MAEHREDLDQPARQLRRPVDASRVDTEVVVQLGSHDDLAAAVDEAQGAHLGADREQR